MQTIIDTNVYFSALVFDRRNLNLIDYCHAKHEVYTSGNILKELEEVLFGPKIKKVYSGFNEAEVMEFYSKIVRESIIILPEFEVTICRDPKDNKFLELAKTIQADFLITGDQDLRDLEEFEGTKILKPGEFVSKFS